MRTGAIFDEAAESSSKDAENIGEDDPTTNAAPRTSWNSTFDRFYIVRLVYRVSKTFLLLFFLLPGRRVFPDTLLRVPASRFFFFRYTQIF